MKWQDKLNKQEYEHFKYATHGVMTLQSFRENRESQKRLDPFNETCYDCLKISRKLGIES